MRLIPFGGGRQADGEAPAVEYFDPSGVFPLISSGLLARLPLRNLHWKSASRPLRSIASLHIDLVPHGEPQPSQARSSNTYSDASARARESGGTPAIDDATQQDRASGEQRALTDGKTGRSRGPVKERRHQIPGLRQTPYLKIYLLRCDDNETYKASSRRLVREWINGNASSQNSSSTNAQENHDAFEWLIVHVVLPNTFAASQPSNLSGSAGASGAAAEKSGGAASRWPGKGSTTVFEKIKADFNGSSKSSLERVAQIRLHKTDIPPHLLPNLPPSVQPSLNEDQQDQDAAWSDLISKLKSLILTSFNLRVIQYEEDIRQRDAQRNLPGWNFCTFFVLKEGLARGFESVGLIEDALVGYDELAVGLDVVTRELAFEAQDIKGTTFIPYTDDLRSQVEAAARLSLERRRPSSSSGQERVDEMAQGEDFMIPLDETKKRYRDLILSNNISLFDFRCYIFSRQMSLLLRQADAWLSRTDLMLRLKANQAIEQSTVFNFQLSKSIPTAKVKLSDDPEDAVTLAKLCERGVEFIPLVARIMRMDLWNGIAQSSADEDFSV